MSALFAVRCFMAARFGDVLYWAFSGLAFLVIAFVVWGYGRPVTRRGDGWRRVVFISCFQSRCACRWALPGR
jgi:hypothetical protein